MSLYVINDLASRDLIEIADYFAETNVEVGERLYPVKIITRWRSRSVCLSRSRAER